MKCLALVRSASWRAALATLALAAGGCGGGTPGDPDGSGSVALSGTAVLGDGGSFFVDFAVDAQGEGNLVAELTWSVTAPGIGRFRGNRPELLLNFYANDCLSCGPVQSLTSVIPPVRLSAHADRGKHTLQITNALLCGGCTIQYTLTAAHSAAAISPKAPCKPSWYVTPSNCTGCSFVNPEVHTSVAPAEARLRVGQTGGLRVANAGCSGDPNFQIVGWESSSTDVARPETAPDDWAANHGVVRAMRPGEADLAAHLVLMDGSTTTAPFAYCPDFRTCQPLVPLILKVLPY